MFGETSIRNARRRSLHVVAGITAVGATLVFGSVSAAAASGTQIVTGSTSGGVLSISAPASLILPTLVAGSSTAATNLGSVSWTDTMNDSVVSSVTLAATNLWHAAGAGLYIPWADFTITVDPTPVANANNTGAPAIVPPGAHTCSRELPPPTSAHIPTPSRWPPHRRQVKARGPWSTTRSRSPCRRARRRVPPSPRRSSTPSPVSPPFSASGRTIEWGFSTRTVVSGAGSGAVIR